MLMVCMLCGWQFVDALCCCVVVVLVREITVRSLSASCYVEVHSSQAHINHSQVQVWAPTTVHTPVHAGVLREVCVYVHSHTCTHPTLQPASFLPQRTPLLSQLHARHPSSHQMLKLKNRHVCDMWHDMLLLYFLAWSQLITYTGSEIHGSDQ